ncbi:MAG TPA: hypothetical protein VMA34_07540 [Terracidiphilus sp.]|nr:hypothetical protein [Terracidiphilus sp.]
MLGRMGLPLVAGVLWLLPGAAPGGQPAASGPVPDVRQLMLEVEAHQKALDKVRENYTFTSFDTTEDVDKAGRVTKTQTEEDDNFFVNGHWIARTVAKDGKPLSGHALDEEDARVKKLVEKAEKTPPGQPLRGPAISVSRLLDLMDVRNPRRVEFRGRPTIVFDFAGRRDVRTHGLAEDMSKKLEGTLWVDEADLQVAQLEVRFDENFHVAGGLVATIEKGTQMRFEQAPQAGGLWLPTGGEGTITARLLLVKGIRQRVTERDFGFKQFHVEAEQEKGARTVPGKVQ